MTLSQRAAVINLLLPGNKTEMETTEINMLMPQLSPSLSCILSLATPHVPRALYKYNNDHQLMYFSSLSYCLDRNFSYVTEISFKFKFHVVSYSSRHVSAVVSCCLAAPYLHLPNEHFLSTTTTCTTH